MEKRSKKISVKKAGGNSGMKSIAYILGIPGSWVQKMGITPDDRDVIIALDEENGRIIMKKVEAQIDSK
ncbi:hypothetical protein DSECCO2_200560 [anaerobic digester metagenome]|jgi:hypothetical protein